MKILCVIDILGSGGAQRQLVTLATNFKKKGHNVTFLVYHSDNFFKSILDKANIPIIIINNTNYIKRFLTIRKYIRTGKYDSILSFLISPNLICELSSIFCKKWKLIVSERSANPNLQKKLSIKLKRFFHLFADRIVTNSNMNIQMINQTNPYLPKKKFIMIRNLVDFTIWYPDYSHLFKKNNIINMVITARHQYLKNLMNLVEAINLLDPSKKQQIKINWFGQVYDNSYNEALLKIKEYQLSNIFTFHNATNNIATYIRQCDVVGLFSKYEGFPNTICEGMACGKPIITTKISDMQLIIKENVNGFLCDSESISSITDAINRLLNKSQIELENMGKNNFILANKLFNPEIITNEYLKIMKNEK
ncbi:MAG: glycosyltransferase [Petrimonas sp.]|nr:glycosyltransferase [Petrimonas sp.]MEA5080300.1 glycosyltransferase [Dysgonamonadaceae bacterium]